MRKKLCPGCKTGAETYQLDPCSPECPYIRFHDGKKCLYYEPMPEEPKQHLLTRFFNKRA